MVRLRGHFDGKGVVLDEPAPPGLEPHTPVEVVIIEDRRQEALREFLAFTHALWERARPPGFQATDKRQWKREELYERGGKRLS